VARLQAPITPLDGSFVVYCLKENRALSWAEPITARCRTRPARIGDSRDRDQSPFERFSALGMRTRFGVVLALRSVRSVRYQSQKASTVRRCSWGFEERTRRMSEPAPGSSPIRSCRGVVGRTVIAAVGGWLSAPAGAMIGKCISISSDQLACNRCGSQASVSSSSLWSRSSRLELGF